MQFRQLSKELSGRKMDCGALFNRPLRREVSPVLGAIKTVIRRESDTKFIGVERGNRGTQRLLLTTPHPTAAHLMV